MKPHDWEPDFSEGEPSPDSKICGLCGQEHSAIAAALSDIEAGRYYTVSDMSTCTEMQCNLCKQVGPFLPRKKEAFPHTPDCPMKEV